MASRCTATVGQSDVTGTCTAVLIELEPFAYLVCRYEKLVTASNFAIWTDPEPVTKLLLDFMKA